MLSGEVIQLRPARPDEAARLGEVALLAKGYWGYPADFLEACRAVLTYPPDEITARRIVVAAAAEIVGFYSVDGEPPHGELGNLWVIPEQIGTGLGSRLWRHALDSARQAGFTELTIEADPHAEGFYLAMGAERIGERPSDAVPGRTLPLLRRKLDQRPTKAATA
ncbi:MAG: GNAT family N-acetyltransferase [Kibdelosporangium sp.]